MQLKDVQALKSRIQTSTFLSRFLGQSTSCAVGVGLTDRDDDYQLAVRVKDEEAREWFKTEFAELLDRHGEDIDVREIGEVTLAPLQPLPPASGTGGTLAIGMGVRNRNGHTGGTLGFFARRNGTRGFVSCNHVIALTDDADLDEEIMDKASGKVIGRLSRVHKLRGFFRPKADCAFAAVDDAHWPDHPGLLPGGGNLSEQFPTLSKYLPVRKIGATTGPTRGRIRTRELDNFPVRYPGNRSFLVKFNDVIEIEGVKNPATNEVEPFSDPGDSGSLVFTEDWKPVGLLFFEKAGGLDNSGFGYANPINLVQSALGVKIVV